MPARIQNPLTTAVSGLENPDTGMIMIVAAITMYITRE